MVGAVPGRKPHSARNLASRNHYCQSYVTHDHKTAARCPCYSPPAGPALGRPGRDPHGAGKAGAVSVLISTLLSLRTLDQTTAKASQRLFALADTPQAMLTLDRQTIERAIYPVGFYRNKAAQILDISQRLLDEFGGHVPDDIDVLTTFHGVGRKTANLVLAEGYGIPAICVDTHVHRISNRWGYVKTKDPFTTEMALRKKLPRGIGSNTIQRWWRSGNISVSPRLPCVAPVQWHSFANALVCSARVSATATDNGPRWDCYDTLFTRRIRRCLPDSR